MILEKLSSFDSRFLCIVRKPIYVIGFEIRVIGLFLYLILELFI